MTNVALIQAVGKKVRKWAEKKVEEHGGFGADLDCFCAIGARELFRALCKENRFENITLCLNIDGISDHCFVMCDGYIVDVTASQFRSNPAVVVKPRKGVDLDRHPYWNITKECKNVRSFNKYLIETDWPEEQMTLTPVKDSEV